MNLDNDSYQINVTKKPNTSLEDNYRDKNRSNSDSFLLPLFLAVVVGIWISPDLIDIRDYIPKDTNQFPYKIEIKKNENPNSI